MHPYLSGVFTQFSACWAMNELSHTATKPISGSAFTHFFAAFLTLFIFVILLEADLFNEVSTFHFQDQDSTSLLWETSSPDELVFAEANPAVPENIPETTNLFSYRDQQAAQPTAPSPDEKSHLPQTEGHIDGHKLVVQAPSPNTTITSEVPTEVHTVSETQASLPGKVSNSPPAMPEKKRSNSLTGIEIPKDVPSKESKKIIQLSDNLLQGTTEKSVRSEDIVTPSMKARPQLSPQATYGRVLSRTNPAPRTGKIAIECKLNPFGVYVQKMLRAIEDQWHQLIQGSRSYIQYDQFPRKVVFKFSLLSSGHIDDLAQANESIKNLGVELCRQSISSRVPFGDWSEEMINSFGHSDEVTITFEYR